MAYRLWRRPCHHARAIDTGRGGGILNRAQDGRQRGCRLQVGLRDDEKHRPPVLDGLQKVDVVTTQCAVPGVHQPDHMVGLAQLLPCDVLVCQRMLFALGLVISRCIEQRQMMPSHQRFLDHEQPDQMCQAEGVAVAGLVLAVEAVRQRLQLLGIDWHHAVHQVLRPHRRAATCQAGGNRGGRPQSLWQQVHPQQCIQKTRLAGTEAAADTHHHLVGQVGKQRQLLDRCGDGGQFARRRQAGRTAERQDGGELFVDQLA